MKMRCSKCRFAQPDPSASERGWTAYQCDNSDSDYWGCLLNVTIKGEKQRWITWSSCDNGEYVKEGDKNGNLL